jgi:16S rRNA (guanine(527)-N(7))-methyltransferase RsmG
VTAPGKSSLETILIGCGIKLEPAQLEQLWRYHRLLRRANATLNLTRIHNFENMVLKHYVDSLLVLKHVDLPSPLIDMGSGAGLPGVPLKIARPEVSMVLAEPRGARASFLGDVCRQLGLVGIEVYAHKLGPGYAGQARGVISRAVGSMAETLDRVASCLVAGGRMLFMKGPECDTELAEAQSTHADFFRLAADHAYAIPGTSHRRRLVVFERLEGPTPPHPLSLEGVTHSGPKRQRGTLDSHSRAGGPPADGEIAFAGVVREITSAANPTFQRLMDLLGGRGIRKYGEAILSGPRLCAEMMARFGDQVIGWLTGGSRGIDSATRSSRSSTSWAHARHSCW